MRHNEIIKYFTAGGKEIPIRVQNKIYLTLHYRDYEKLLIACHRHRLSLSEMIRLMTGPCQACGHDKIEIPLIIIQPTTIHQGNALFNKKNDHETNI